MAIGRATLAAVLAAFVIIPAMATAGTQLAQGGSGLLFIFLPNLFKGMPGGSIIAIMFFWILGKDFVEKQVNTGREKPFHDKFFALCKYVFCPVCFLVLILGIIMGGIG